MNTFASLFTGFGGADVGAFAAGFTPIWGVEFDPAIAEVAKLNGAHILVDDVRRVNYAALTTPDLLHASPVCKNASIAKRDGGEAAEDIETAEAVIRAVRALKPRAFTLENVRGYREFQSFKNILAALRGEGYAVAVDVLNSADYGVPQTRERLFVIARRDGARPQFPAHTHAPAEEISPLFDDRKPHVGWLAAIADLVDGLPDTEFAPWQLERMPARLRDSVYFGAGGFDGGVVQSAKSAPAFTVTANTNQASQLRAFILSGENAGSVSYNERRADEPAFVVSASQKAATRAFIVDGQPQFGSDNTSARMGDEPAQTITATQTRRPLRAFVVGGQDGQVRTDNEPANTISGNADRSRAFLATTNQVIREWTVRDGEQPAMTITASAGYRPTATPMAGVHGRIVKMSPRCLARFQSFPDTYILPEKPSLAVRGIGNAVPPLMYQRIAETLR